MSTLTKKLLLCFSLMLFSIHDAYAARFGVQTGLYKDRVGNKYSAAGSSELGLRLGFYIDKTAHDLMYASMMNGVDMCAVSGSCATTETSPNQAGGRMSDPRDFSKQGTYLLVLPNQQPIQQPTYYNYQPTPPISISYNQQFVPMGMGQQQGYYPQPPQVSYNQQSAPMNQPMSQPYSISFNQQVATPQYMPQQQSGYYREPVNYTPPEYQQPVRGLW